jgi:hypothetical protein
MIAEMTVVIVIAAMMAAVAIVMAAVALSTIWALLPYRGPMKTDRLAKRRMGRALLMERC